MPKSSRPNAFPKAIRAVLRRHCARKKTAILFTGGLDSTVLALLSQEMEPLLVFAAVDDPLCLDYNRRSIATCRKLARMLKLQFIVVPVRKKDYLQQVLPVSRALRQAIDDPDLPAALHLLKQLRQRLVRVVISGMGADDVFRLPAPKIWTFLNTEAAEAVWSHTRIAQQAHMTFICPFLSPTVTRLALATPWTQRRNKQPLKELLSDYPEILNALQASIASHSFIPESFLRPMRLILTKTTHGPSTKTASKG